MSGRGGFESGRGGGERSHLSPSEYNDLIRAGSIQVEGQAKRDKRARMQKNSRAYRESITSTGYSQSEVQAYAASHRITLSEARNKLFEMEKDARAKAMKDFVDDNKRSKENKRSKRHQEDSTSAPRRQSSETRQQTDDPGYGVPGSSDYLETVVAHATSGYGRGDMPSREYSSTEYHETPVEYDPMRAGYTIPLAESPEQHATRKRVRKANLPYKESITSTGYSYSQVKAYADFRRIKVAEAREALDSMDKDTRAEAMQNFIKKNKPGRKSRGGDSTSAPRWQSSETQQRTGDLGYGVSGPSDYLEAIAARATSGYGRGGMPSLGYSSIRLHDTSAPSLAHPPAGYYDTPAVPPGYGRGDMSSRAHLSTVHHDTPVQSSVYSPEGAAPPSGGEYGRYPGTTRQPHERPDSPAALMRKRTREIWE